jgi:hypothetical protein
MADRLRWLRERGILDQTIPEIHNNSLKTTVIKQIFRDASNDELLNLQRYVQQQLLERGTDVKVLLSPYNDDFKSRCLDQEVYVIVIKPIILDYMTINHPDIKGIQLDNVIEFIADARPPKFTNIVVTVDALTLEKYGLSFEELDRAFNKIEEILEQLEEQRGGEPDIYKEWRKYITTSITNPYLISAVEQLRSKNGRALPSLIITTIRVPYGKVIKECFDDRYGDYVEFVDEKEE